MDKHARQAMIDQLQQANAATLADLAARRQRREMRGEVLDDITRANYAPPVIRKIHQPQDDAVLCLADEVGIVTGRLERELNALREEVTGLRIEIAILAKAKQHANA